MVKSDIFEDVVSCARCHLCQTIYKKSGENRLAMHNTNVHRKKEKKNRREGKNRRWCVWSTEFIQFLAALAIVHQDDLKNR